MTQIREFLKSLKWYEYLIIAVAFGWRFVALDLKPPHFDEGINGWFVDGMFERGFYEYNPENYHGPLHFYLLQLFIFVFGRSMETMRSVTGLFSMAIVILALVHKRFVGRVAVWAALVFALSPGYIFYSRYAIHETEQAFFMLLLSYGFLRWRTLKDEASVWAMAIGVTGMAATKETWFIHGGTMLIAIWMLPRLAQIFKSENYSFENWKVFKGTGPGPKQIQKIVALCTFGMFVFFMGFFFNPEGFVDFFKAYFFWQKTGHAGNGHEKPFFYWLQLMNIYEWTMLGTLVLSLGLIWRGSYLLRYFFLNAVGTLLAYSIISYKTPWCLISIVWAVPFITGYVIEAVGEWLAMIKRPLKFIPHALLLVGSIHALKLDWELNFVRYDDEKEKFVYVSSYRSLNQFMATVNAARDRYPAIKGEQIHVCMKSYWPLPWLLGLWPKVAFHGENCPSDVSDGVLILVDRSQRQKASSLLTANYFDKEYRLRDAQEPFVAYFRKDRFEGLLDQPEDARVRVEAGR